MRKAILPALIVAGCAAVPPPANDRGQALAEALRGRVAAETTTCVPISPGTNLTVLNAGTLIYDRGGTVWVNRLYSDCPGLDTVSTLIIEPSASQYCIGDRFRELEWGASIPGPQCVLGDFVANR